MRLILNRDIATTEYTLGKLKAGALDLFTCEDAVRDFKIPKVTAIPAGIYKIMITWSNRFKKHLPLLLDVPNFSGVRIHSGNTAADTEGCILVGTTRARDSVTNSRHAMDLLLPIIADHLKTGEDVFIQIL